MLCNSRTISSTMLICVNYSLQSWHKKDRNEMARGINRGKKCNNVGIKDSQGETDIIVKKSFINFLYDKDFKAIKIN